MAEKSSNLRNVGMIPGTVYGKGMNSINFTVNSAELKKFLCKSGKVFEVDVDGKGKHLVNLDSIQKDHMGDAILHVAFHKIEANQKTVVKLPIILTGAAIGFKSGGIVQQVLKEVEVKGLPKDMPESIIVDISSLEVHAHWTLNDVNPPPGLEWHHNMNDNIVSCHTPRVEVVATASAESEASETAAAANEVATSSAQDEAKKAA